MPCPPEQPRPRPSRSRHAQRRSTCLGPTRAGRCGATIARASSGHAFARSPTSGAGTRCGRASPGAWGGPPPFADARANCAPALGPSAAISRSGGGSTQPTSGWPRTPAAPGPPGASGGGSTSVAAAGVTWTSHPSSGGLWTKPFARSCASPATFRGLTPRKLVSGWGASAMSNAPSWSRPCIGWRGDCLDAPGSRSGRETKAPRRSRVRRGRPSAPSRVQPMSTLNRFATIGANCQPRSRGTTTRRRTE